MLRSEVESKWVGTSEQYGSVVDDIAVICVVMLSQICNGTVQICCHSICYFHLSFGAYTCSICIENQLLLYWYIYCIYVYVFVSFRSEWRRYCTKYIILFQNLHIIKQESCTQCGTFSIFEFRGADLHVQIARNARNAFDDCIQTHTHTAKGTKRIILLFRVAKSF